MKKKSTRARADGWHLVLGGSDGIGFAFAEWLAEHQCRLIVVARNKERLSRARTKLLASGAAEVRILAGDLLNPRFRAGLFRRASTIRLSLIFIGGPSPPAGTIDQISSNEVEAGAKSCLAYPVDVMRFALSHHASRKRDPLTIIFLSSSASKDDLPDHPFFLSALFRSAAEHLLKRIAELHLHERVELLIWRPTVVYTRLAKAYAATLPLFSPDGSLSDRLRRIFHSPVPSPTEYIQSITDKPKVQSAPRR
jgi:NAD(P)-dependent dehydrogenase (short-subunit alcohol dehydrogenase family)